MFKIKKCIIALMVFSATISGCSSVPPSDPVPSVEVNNLQTVWAGPGEDYLCFGEDNIKENYKVIRVEKNWAEIEYNDIRRYIAVPENDYTFEKAPHVVESLDQNVHPYPVLYHHPDFSVLAKKTVKLYSSPKLSHAITDVQKDQTVKILSMDSNGLLNRVFHAEIENSKGKIRGYINLFDLLDCDNPANGFENVKTDNAIIEHEGVEYYSTTGVSRTSFDGWKELKNDSFTARKVDLLAGITGVIAGNDLPDEPVKSVQGKIELQNATTMKFYNATSGRRGVSKFYSIADFIVSTVNSFVESGITDIPLDVHCLQYGDLKKIAIFTGDPIETPLAGKKISLSSLISKNAGDTPLSMLEADEKANEAIHRMYPTIPESSKCGMEITFSNDFSDQPYGYAVFFDKAGHMYGKPIIHEGTHFLVYCDKELYTDAAFDLRDSIVEFDENTAQIIIQALAEKGYNLKTTTSISGKKEDQNSAWVDLFPGNYSNTINDMLVTLSIPSDDDWSWLAIYYNPEKSSAEDMNFILEPDQWEYDLTGNKTQNSYKLAIKSVDESQIELQLDLPSYKGSDGVVNSTFTLYRDDDQAVSDSITDLEALVGEWTIDADKTHENGNWSLQEYFGTAIKYGYKLTISPDGSFEYYIGAGIGGNGTCSLVDGSVFYDINRYEGGSTESGSMKFFEEDNAQYLIMEFDKNTDWEMDLYWRKLVE